MLLLSDSDEELLLRVRRLLYTIGLTSLTLPYRELLVAKLGEEVEGLILTNPYDPELPMRFSFTFRRKHPKIPVLMFVQPLRERISELDDATALIDATLPSGKLLGEILLTLSRFHGRDVALFHLGSARDHLLDPDPTWSGIAIHMTPIERNIFRHLIRANYHPVSAKELHRYFTKPGTYPTVCNIASHIYRINYKAKEELGYHIILSEGGGYRLLTEEELSTRSF